MPEWVLTVAQLNEYVRCALAADPMLRSIRLRGEISNWKRHSSGHAYFTLKDEEARISCVMFRTVAQALSVRPQDGMRVVLTGSVALYARDGQYQFYVDALRVDGVGALYVQFEQLKQRLQAEGLFDAGRKRPLPLLPKGIGIVTSPTGAVIRDIEQIARRRHPGIPLYLYPVRVQGDGATDEIVRGISMLDAFPAVDVLIIGRGGGSLEELWAFNEETVVRAIARCQKVIVSAVGHETDFTISDFVADLRAPTPSAAAELVVPEREALMQMLQLLTLRMKRAQTRQMESLRQCVLRNGAALERYQPIRMLAQHRAAVEAHAHMLRVQCTHALSARREQVYTLGARLKALGPAQVLGRGYAYVTTDAGKLIRCVKSLAFPQSVRVVLQDGALIARVEAIEGRNQDAD